MSQNEVKVETLTTSQGFTKHVWSPSSPNLFFSSNWKKKKRDEPSFLTNNFVDVVIKVWSLSYYPIAFLWFGKLVRARGEERLKLSLPTIKVVSSWSHLWLIAVFVEKSSPNPLHTLAYHITFDSPIPSPSSLESNLFSLFSLLTNWHSWRKMGQICSY